MIVLYAIPYRHLGFSDEEWEAMPTAAKRIITSFYLNGRSVEETEKFEHHETDFSVRRTVKKYRLFNRPPVIVRREDLNI